jgi:hypothetical protein
LLEASRKGVIIFKSYDNAGLKTCHSRKSWNTGACK